MMRIGFGEDIHLLMPGRKLILGGVTIPFELGLLGHSDADALLHAIADALLGSLALGDIGKFFPPSNLEFRNLDSAIIASKSYQMVKERGYHIVNIDANIVTEKPKLRPYIDAIRARTAEILGIDVEQVSVKAKTNEGCDAVGELKAIRTNAVVLIEKGE